MDILYFVLIAIAIAFILWQIFVFIKSKRSVGKEIPFEELDSDLTDKVNDKVGLLYFFSPTCNNCKKQSPIIENISRKNANIIPVDTSKNLKAAKVFNIIGTPTFIFFGGNKIKGYYVGLKRESFILDKLNNIE